MSKSPTNGGDSRDELYDLWHGQNLEMERLSLDEIRRKARKFESDIRNRNLREYIAAAIVVVAFSVIAFRASDIWARTGALLVVIAALYVTYVLHGHGASHLPGGEARLTMIHFHRSSLERQRDLLRNIWRWYLLPFVPGFTLITWAAALRDGVIMNPNRTPEQVRHGFNLLRFAVLQVAFLFAVAALNKRAARKLQLKINALDEEEKQ